MDNELIAIALRHIGKNIILIADCIHKEDEQTADVIPIDSVDETKEKPKRRARKISKDEPKDEEAEKPNITFEQVRAALAEKSRDGYTLAVKNLVQSFGVEKLSDIKPEMYTEIMKQAEMIGYD